MPVPPQDTGEQMWPVLLHRLKQPLSENANSLLPRMAEESKTKIFCQEYVVVAIGKDALAKRRNAGMMWIKPETGVLPVEHIDACLGCDDTTEDCECLCIQVVNKGRRVGDGIGDGR